MNHRLGFGVFLAPHHPIGEHPTLQFERDLELAEWLDDLQYDEFWVGEHHSAGWETIASPEMFLVGAAMRTKRIRLGTGVVSIPYHHPFNVAQRIVQLDHMSRGRAMLGVGPGALPSDAFMLGIDPMTQRDRMDEGLGVILRLLGEDEPFSFKGSFFELNDAALQIRPLQEKIPVACASTISPSGMKAAGKHGTGVLSIASYSEEGLQALPTQWHFGEMSAKEHGHTIDRRDWRIVIPFHLSDSKEQALREVGEGLKKWQNEYIVGILGSPQRHPFSDGYEAAKRMTEFGGAIIGTPDDAVEKIARLQELAGGFGTILAFAHDWTNREQQLRSYEMIARYVMPRVQGMIRPIQRSADRVTAKKGELMQAASGAVLKAIRDFNATHPREDAGPKKSSGPKVREGL
ncbi:MAG TPA: LLM class flavin-dependent oxidoreductase [Candidatus Binataceae bacterium]|nr:LLM class flavin-dependent oxidoreductase [Candidatus Binataceae bacterium]